MIAVSDLIKALSKHPPDFMAYACEGEETGIVVVGKNGNHVETIEAMDHACSNQCRKDGGCDNCY